MSQKLFTQSVENFTVSITNGGADSDAKKLKDRDNRTLGVNVTGSSVVTIEFDYGANFTGQYLILGNLTTSDSFSYTIDYYDGSWNNILSDSDIWTNENVFFDFSLSAIGTKFRIVFTPTTSKTLQIASAFLGEIYTLPVSYQYENQRTIFRRTEIQSDWQGYPYGNDLSSTNKRRWPIVYRLSKTQLATLETNLGYCGINHKPFFFSDSIIDSNIHLCKLLEPELIATQLSADYFEVPLNIVEI